MVDTTIFWYMSFVPFLSTSPFAIECLQCSLDGFQDSEARPGWIYARPISLKISSILASDTSLKPAFAISKRPCPPESERSRLE